MKILRRHPNDVEFARLFRESEAEKGTSPLFAEGALWLWTDGQYWRPVSDNEAKQLLLSFADAAQLRFNFTALEKSLSALKMICDEPDAFLTTPPCAALANRTYQLSRDSAGRVALIARKHEPELRCRFRFDFSYVEGDEGIGAEPLRFLGFLNQVWLNDADRLSKIEMLREYIGACLLGMAAQFQKALLLYGPLGSNGKSTLVDFLSLMFQGHLSNLAPLDLKDQYRLAGLAGVRVNLLGEIPAQQIKDAAAIKQVISGDLATARQIYAKPFSFKPIAGHVWGLNRLPSVEDAGDAFWRRWILLKFNRQFTDADKLLPAEIIRSLIPEIPTVVSWCLDGARNLMERGYFQISESAGAELSSWRYKADMVVGFAEDACEKMGAKGRSPVGEVYDAFRKYCFKRGHEPPSLPVFVERMKSIGYNSKRGDRGYCFPLRLRDQSAWEAKGDLSEERNSK